MNVTTIPGKNPANGTSNDQNERSFGKIIAFVAGGLLLIGALIWLLSGSDEPRQVELTLQKGESLTGVLGFGPAIDTAEQYGLPIRAKLYGTTQMAQLTPADARKLAGSATDVVLVTVKVMPGDRVTYELDDENKVVPGSVVFTPLMTDGVYR